MAILVSINRSFLSHSVVKLLWKHCRETEGEMSSDLNFSSSVISKRTRVWSITSGAPEGEHLRLRLIAIKRNSNAHVFHTLSAPPRWPTSQLFRERVKRSQFTDMFVRFGFSQFSDRSWQPRTITSDRTVYNNWPLSFFFRARRYDIICFVCVTFKYTWNWEYVAVCDKKFSTCVARGLKKNERQRSGWKRLSPFQKANFHVFLTAPWDLDCRFGQLRRALRVPEKENRRAWAR